MNSAQYRSGRSPLRESVVYTPSIVPLSELMRAREEIESVPIRRPQYGTGVHMTGEDREGQAAPIPIGRRTI